MRKWMLTGLAAGLLVMSGKADEKAPEQASNPAPAPPACGVSHGVVESCRTEYQVHWLEREVPHTQTKMTLREVITPATKCGLEIDWKSEQRTRSQLVLKPQEVIKEVTICTKKPKVVKDPCTGCDTIIFEPVTETKQVKVVTYCLVPEEKVVTIQTGCLKPVEKPIAHLSLVLDCTTETVMKKERYGVVVPVEIKERKPCPPPCLPVCPH